ncbi:UDP-2,3-diacylglucosamine diphosphatase [Crateriforma conspicua]|uniref:UDP-2,3-diacylglucosamine hydrolase n=1 Tax=Crateriforma conspicua TaxID=2527996 RepID=A0A5C6FUS7_9PLAN|nr:UDP-2,3-diacylglucosamine diphosphatase [Crateriforma conspicua]TWU64873.1 UDP-2,3-diacylglucosamine hydrolase [Crateriforma conspicua]
MASAATSVRTLLISDVHLGCKHAQVKACLDFLQSYQPEQIYLVGDFIDGWKCNKGWHWPDECNQILNHLEQLIREGTEVFYVPGNHDAFLRNADYLRMIPEAFSQVKIADEFVFETLQGWRLLITHGDLFDFFETRAQWVSRATAGVYDFVLSLNRWVNRRRVGSNPYGACAFLKDRVKRGVRFISSFESSIMQHARQRRCEGVVCGHIHTPAIVRRKDSIYFNTGDWVENCTGLVEHHDGTIRLESTYGTPKTLQLNPHERLAMRTRSASADDRSDWYYGDDTERFDGNVSVESEFEKVRQIAG